MRDRALAGWLGELIADGMSCPPGCGVSTASLGRRWFSRWLLRIGLEDGSCGAVGWDDWAEDHHDVAVMDATGRTLAKARLPEGVAGIARLHAMLGERIGQDTDGVGQVQVGIKTDRGPWVQALIAAGYTVLAVNPLQAARYRERLGVSGVKSDTADAHMLADMVRTDAHQLRPVAADSAQAEAVKVVTRLHKTLIWERTRAGQRLRHALREYFPAALAAFEDLDAPTRWSCWPGPPTRPALPD